VQQKEQSTIAAVTKNGYSSQNPGTNIPANRPFEQNTIAGTTLELLKGCLLPFGGRCCLDKAHCKPSENMEYQGDRPEIAMV